ncbi:MAG: hypothetical protein GY953_01010, partial [bacterium]|nr:hypothetical protein [bacterium]
MHWRSVFNWLSGGRSGPSGKSYRKELIAINRIREDLRSEPGKELRNRLRGSKAEVFASVAEAARRTLHLNPFDVQVIGGLAMVDGKIAEMQTGEGKTLVATMPAVWGARGGRGVHILTANDYLAKRDAAWMGEVYQFLGLTVGAVAQGMAVVDRKKAYGCDITYGSATEVGFDFLRDQLCRRPEEIVQRPFQLAIVDEVDSILIDEARIPLVIAGGQGAPADLVQEADRIARQLEAPAHSERVDGNRRVILTDAGALRAEALLGCDNLFSPANSAVLAALSQALHAHKLLERDVDYLVKDGRLDLVDEFKGRIAQNRRWPDGLQAAVEAKERLPVRHAGRVLGEIAMQNFIGLYPDVCGMTGTAATQADEFREIYGLEVEVIPTNRPVIRVEHDAVVLGTETEKFQAVGEEVRREHARGRPVLVGTVSVAASERLGRLLSDASIPHEILNARNEEAEAAIIREAGRPGAVTISTNMAGRGTDIVLGEGAAALGGLYVIGTNRHESRRIDNQLRGRAGRQGDPGESRFFLSLEDDMFREYSLDAEVDINRAQRVIEGQHLSVRSTLWKYERIIELQRRIIHDRRRAVLVNRGERTEAERQVTISVIDDWWSR